jgi:hypothetical protein
MRTRRSVPSASVPSADRISTRLPGRAGIPGQGGSARPQRAEMAHASEVLPIFPRALTRISSGQGGKNPGMGDSGSGRLSTSSKPTPVTPGNAMDSEVSSGQTGSTSSSGEVGLSDRRGATASRITCRISRVEGSEDARGDVCSQPASPCKGITSPPGRPPLTTVPPTSTRSSTTRRLSP